MKKILVVALLLATAAVPATPSYAATMAAPKATPALCFFLPFLPDCAAIIKDEMKKGPMMPKMAMPTMPKMSMAAPTMPMMPTCTKAAAGSGHLLDCGKM
jgi:hypothetical protein